MKYLQRINELAALQKQRELTPQEKKEQQELRQLYLIEFRSAAEQVLLNTKVIDPLGEDVTPEKVKRHKQAGDKKDDKSE